MLQELSIKNLAIIEAVSLDFSEGMTVLTGETGAGKSIIIDAVGLLAGGRGSVDYIRQGEAKLELEGTFYDAHNHEELKTILLDQGIDYNAGNIIIQRDIYASGRTICKVNGQSVTIAKLKEISQYLVDIQGQHEHQALMQPKKHLPLLDQFAKSSIEEQKSSYQGAYSHYRKIRQERLDFQYNEQETAQKIDMLSFQIQEIESAQLDPEEEEKLDQERDQLRNYQKIMAALAQSYAVLQGEEEANALNFLGLALDEMTGIEDLHPDYKETSQQLRTAFYASQEAASSLYSMMDDLAYDEGRLNEIEARLEAINQLKRKYGASIEEVISYGQKAQEELSGLTNQESRLEELEIAEKTIGKTVLEEGLKLSQIRRQEAKELEDQVHQQLASLYMGRVVFQVRFTKPIDALSLEDARESGLDQLEFYISTNPGEDLKPLEKIASGGELSRMMLALKTIFSKQQGVTSIIFDEVDSGVSGRVAAAIADKIYTISKHSQVLCITHLPQVAAIADHHYLISKQVEDERTSTHVRPLEESEIVEEVARMMSGEEVTENTLKSAQELRENRS